MANKPDSNNITDGYVEKEILPEDIKVGDIVVPIKNSCSHNYTLNTRYRVIETNITISGMFGPHESNAVHAEPLTPPENIVFKGNNLNPEDCLVYRRVKAKQKKIFDLLVLPQEQRNLIKNAITSSKADNGIKIFQNWGFEETIEKGIGTILLFWGLPGTGKTMCAQGVAEMLNQPFSIIGAAELYNCYFGETEKQIKKCFKEATQRNKVMILDECDSLVSSRDKVIYWMKPMINTLLTEIERFRGVCILTTNRLPDLDPALERRIALKLEFKRPTEEERAVIWRNLIPSTCPLHKDVDFSALSKYDLTGGQIKNVILLAARNAVGTNSKNIKMDHFVSAAKQEIASSNAWKKSKEDHELDTQPEDIMDMIDAAFPPFIPLRQKLDGIGD